MTGVMVLMTFPYDINDSCDVLNGWSDDPKVDFNNIIDFVKKLQYTQPCGNAPL